jgi:dihydropteroate synthase
MSPLIPQLHCGRFSLSLDRPKVMGIINVTPDSFSDGGRYGSFAAALAHARQLIAEGADVLDIGGESTRPGAAAVSEQEELERIVPLVEALRDAQVPLSVDTRKSSVMRAAIAAGADMINDVYALRAPGAMEVVAPSGVAICLMHMQGEPAVMQQAPHYDDVVAEVRTFLRARTAACLASGIARERILVDPGFGFGKTLEHNLALLRHMRELVADGFPVLGGLSRKSSLGALTGRDVDDRLPASVAAALAMVARGASMIRVHDVAATVDALKVWNAAAFEAVVA